jgi:hypothetical protein
MTAHLPGRLVRRQTRKTMMRPLFAARRALFVAFLTRTNGSALQSTRHSTQRSTCGQEARGDGLRTGYACGRLVWIP